MAIGKKPVLGGREAVKVAIVQKAPRFLDKEASLARAETHIAEAAAGGADLICKEYADANRREAITTNQHANLQ